MVADKCTFDQRNFRNVVVYQVAVFIFGGRNVNGTRSGGRRSVNGIVNENAVDGSDGAGVGNCAAESRYSLSGIVDKIALDGFDDCRRYRGYVNDGTAGGLIFWLNTVRRIADKISSDFFNRSAFSIRRTGRRW